MKKLLLIIFIFLFSACATNTSCLISALTQAEKVQDKSTIIFVEGWVVYPDARHVQLWVFNKEKGIFEIKSGKMSQFYGVKFYSYRQYMARVNKYHWLDKIKNKHQRKSTNKSKGETK